MVHLSRGVQAWGWLGYAINSGKKLKYWQLTSDAMKGQTLPLCCALLIVHENL